VSGRDDRGADILRRGVRGSIDRRRKGYEVAAGAKTRSGRPTSVGGSLLRYTYYIQLRTLGIPIDIDRFEGAPEDGLRAGGPTNAEVVLDFLAANPGQAFTPKEIHERTDVARGSVGVVLSRLHEDGSSATVGSTGPSPTSRMWT
jgi:hypothetical protein